jgi:DNA-binding LacI/PurR family transcriptional regulator
MNKVAIYQGFLCTVKGTDVLRITIERCLKNIKDRNLTSSCLGVTGTILLGMVYRELGIDGTKNTESTKIGYIPNSTYMYSYEYEHDNVILDNEYGGYLATDHLIQQGYRNIAILAGPKNLGISNARMDGYLKALKENNLKVDAKNIIHCDFNQDYAYFATKELLKAKNRPDAIFTISDRMAIGAMIAIKERGLKMPTDIGLIGFNNEPMLSLLTPTISSIEQPMFEIGKMAAKIFIERLHSEESAITTEVLKPTLIIRESSKRNFI